MFGIGVSELLVIFFVALLVLGPDRLPAAARTMAKMFGEFRRATDDLRTSLVGITDIDDDWRREHNNPRIVDSRAKEPPEPESEIAPKVEPEIIARGSENAHG